MKICLICHVKNATLRLDVVHDHALSVHLRFYVMPEPSTVRVGDVRVRIAVAVADVAGR